MSINPQDKKQGKSVLPHRPKDEELLHPGSLVTWQRGDGSNQEGFVDFLHTDPEGQRWAFVSFGKMWAVVNRKLLTVATS